MRILFVLEYYYPHIGGVETLFKSLAESLVTHGHRVTVLTNQYDKSLPKIEEHGNLTIRRLPYRNRYLFTLFSIIPAIAEARNHDIIHTTSYNAAIPAFFASKLTNTKSLITFHEVWARLWFRLPWMFTPSKVVHYLFEKFILQLSFDQFVAVSESTKDALVKNGIKKSNISTIYNGIDYDEFKMSIEKEKTEIFNFLFYGRLGISKGIDLLLKSTAILKEQNLDFDLTLILPLKPVKLLNKIRALIIHLKLGSHVRIIESLPFDQLKKKIANSDCVIIPSHSEGFCFAAVETMALRVPIISSGKGALKEVIGGKHLHFRPFSPEGLSESMKDAVKGNWDTSKEKYYPLEQSILQYEKLYSVIMDKEVS